jgi:WS/DGAT C-terminal domain
MNITVTNVPGPGTPIYMTGAKLVDIYGFALAANGLGLVNMVSSYAGSLTIGFQCGVAMMPDPERYVACPRRSMAELVSATALTNRNGSARGCGPQGCFWGPIGYPVGADDSPPTPDRVQHLVRVEDLHYTIDGDFYPTRCPPPGSGGDFPSMALTEPRQSLDKLHKDADIACKGA